MRESKLKSCKSRILNSSKRKPFPNFWWQNIWHIWSIDRKLGTLHRRKQWSLANKEIWVSALYLKNVNNGLVNYYSPQNLTFFTQFCEVNSLCYNCVIQEFNLQSTVNKYNYVLKFVINALKTVVHYIKFEFKSDTLTKNDEKWSTPFRLTQKISFFRLLGRHLW